MEETKSEDKLNKILKLEEERIKLKNTINSSGNILIVIGFLTMINVPALVFFQIVFPVGLFAPFLFIEKLAIYITDKFVYWYIYSFINLVFWVYFGFIGKQAIKNSKIAFYFGLASYIFDTILSILYQEWLTTVFHFYFLYLIYSGFSKLDKLSKKEEEISLLKSSLEE